MKLLVSIRSGELCTDRINLHASAISRQRAKRNFGGMSNERDQGEEMDKDSESEGIGYILMQTFGEEDTGVKER